MVKLDENLPKPLKAAMLRGFSKPSYASQTDYEHWRREYGGLKNDVKGVFIDFEKSIYREITPEEALQLYKDNKGEDVFVVIGGRLANAYRGPNGNRRYRFSNYIANLDIHKKNGKLVTETTELTPRELYENADHIYYAEFEAPIDQTVRDVRRKNPESRYTNRGVWVRTGHYRGSQVNPVQAPLPDDPVERKQILDRRAELRYKYASDDLEQKKNKLRAILKDIEDTNIYITTKQSNKAAATSQEKYDAKKKEYISDIEYQRKMLESRLKQLFNAEFDLYNIDKEFKDLSDKYDLEIQKAEEKKRDLEAQKAALFKRTTESLDEDLLLEKLPKDLKKAYAYGYSLQSRLSGDNDFSAPISLDLAAGKGYAKLGLTPYERRVNTVTGIDFENSIYKEVTPEEAINLYNNGEGLKLHALFKAPNNPAAEADRLSIIHKGPAGNMFYDIYPFEDRLAFEPRSAEEFYNKASKIYYVQEVGMDAQKWHDRNYGKHKMPVSNTFKQTPPELGKDPEPEEIISYELFNGNELFRDHEYIKSNWFEISPEKGIGMLYALSDEVPEVKGFSGGEWTGKEDDYGQPYEGNYYPLEAWESVLEALETDWHDEGYWDVEIGRVKEIIRLLKAGKSALGDPRNYNWSGYDYLKKKKAEERYMDVQKAFEQPKKELQDIVWDISYFKRAINNARSQIAAYKHPEYIDNYKKTMSKVKDETSSEIERLLKKKVREGTLNAIDDRLQELMKNVFNIEASLERVGTDEMPEIAKLNRELNKLQPQLDDAIKKLDAFKAKYRMKTNEDLTESVSLLEKLPKDLSRAYRNSDYLREVSVGVGLPSEIESGIMNGFGYGNIDSRHPVFRPLIDFENSTYTKITPEQALEYYEEGKGLQVHCIYDHDRLCIIHKGPDGEKVNDLIVDRGQFVSPRTTVGFSAKEVYDNAEAIYYVEEVSDLDVRHSIRAQNPESRYSLSGHTGEAYNSKVEAPPISDGINYLVHDDGTAEFFVDSYWDGLALPGFDEDGHWTGDLNTVGYAMEYTRYPLEAWEQILDTCKKKGYDETAVETQRVINILSRGKSAFGDASLKDWSHYDWQKKEKASVRYERLRKYLQDNLRQARALSQELPFLKPSLEDAENEKAVIMDPAAVNKKKNLARHDIEIIKQGIEQKIKLLFDLEASLEKIGTEDDEDVVKANAKIAKYKNRIDKIMDEIDAIKAKIKAEGH